MDPITRKEMFMAAAAGNGTAPEPITREEKFLQQIAEAVGGGGGGAGGAVQSVNGKTGKVELAYDDLKNRPFGVVGTKTEIVLPETSVTIDEQKEDHVFKPVPAQIALVLGDEYKVTFDGVDYLCVAKEIPEAGIITIGNQGLSENFATNFGFETTGEPFCIAFDSEGMNFLLGAKTAGTYSVKVEHFAEEVKTLDPKYLPFVTLFDSENGVKADVSIEQIKAAYEKGPVLAKLWGMIFRFEWLSGVYKWAHESVYIDNGEFTLMYKTYVYNEETTEWEFGEDRYFPLTTT